MMAELAGLRLRERYSDWDPAAVRWSRYTWLAGAITTFMPFCTASVAVMVPLVDPDAGSSIRRPMGR